MSQITQVDALGGAVQNLAVQNGDKVQLHVGDFLVDEQQILHGEPVAAHLAETQGTQVLHIGDHRHDAVEIVGAGPFQIHAVGQRVDGPAARQGKTVVDLHLRVCRGPFSQFSVAGAAPEIGLFQLCEVDKRGNIPLGDDGGDRGAVGGNAPPAQLHLGAAEERGSDPRSLLIGAGDPREQKHSDK